MDHVIIKPNIIIDDISNGQEEVQISFVNERNFQNPLKFVCYTSTCILVSDTLTDDFESVPLPCQCENSCNASCSCGLGSNITYQNDKLSEDYLCDSTKPIIECSVLCICKSCPNRVVQNGIKFHLQVFMTNCKGFGVKTLDFIPKLAFVCEYAGELIDMSEAEKRFNNQNPDEPNYIFVLKEHSFGHSNTYTIIDPTYNGNVGRYLNHSCSPNLIPVPVRANSMVPRICFFAKLDIMPNEELTYNYGSCLHKEKFFPSYFKEKDCFKLSEKKCYCKSSQCQGFLPYEGF